MGGGGARFCRRAVPPGLCACASRKPPQSPCVVGTKGWRVLGGASGAVVEEGRRVVMGRPSLWAMRWLMDGMVDGARRGSLLEQY